MNRDVCVIIPVYNEGEVVRQTIEQVLAYYSNVVCVDDGSRDNSAQRIQETKALLVEHPINMGQGAALQTGIEFALQDPHTNYFVTFDADGQHDPKDVGTMLTALKHDKLDVVLGSRFLGATVNMPRLKRLVLSGAIRFTNIFSSVRLTDTHNGLRVFNRAFAERVDIRMTGMAHASEIIDKIGKGGWKYKEVPVTIHYTDYTRAKGQSVLNSLNIVMELFLNRPKK
jgi:glycosyltransferase involved in cell wall biosynthesis